VTRSEIITILDVGSGCRLTAYRVEGDRCRQSTEVTDAADTAAAAAAAVAEVDSCWR